MSEDNCIDLRMYNRYRYYIYIDIILFTHAGQAEDYCTSGFISLDRIHAVLGNYNGTDVMEFGSSAQAIIPGINFTCSGSVKSWTFGTQWKQDTDFIELQIWRPDSEDGSYTKVGSTTINVEEKGQTELYQYPLSSPLHFQAGDILGYYCTQNMSLKFGSGHPLYYTYRDTAASHFSVHDSETKHVERYHKE